MPNEKQNQKEASQDSQDNQGKVELDQETYQALLNRLDELEGNPQGSKNENEDDVDSLADEVRQPARQPQEVDYDNMSQSELVKHLEGVISENVLGPMAVAIEGIKVEMEIDRLTRDGKHEDFFDLKKKVFKVAKANPRLSIKDAYDLVKSKESERTPRKATKAEEEEETDNRGEKGEDKGRQNPLRHLPRPSQMHGEKPGGGSSMTTKVPPKTLREATERAWEDLDIKE